MKRKNMISAIALTLALGVGGTVYAASSDGGVVSSQRQRLGLGRITSIRGYDYISNILKSKLGISDEDIVKATNSGKTLYDLAIEKGMTQEQISASLLEEKTKAIEDAVKNGTIRKEEGEALKTNLKTNIENCTFNFGQGQRGGRGIGNHFGRRAGVPLVTNNSNLK